MTEKPARFNILLYLSLFIIILFITSHLWGGNIFENDWSFIHWQQIPLWYLMILVFLLTVGSFVIIKKKNLFDNAFDSSSKLYSGQIILLIILIFFQFDSFLYGGGNHLINQIAQTETIIYRWFEFGSILIVSIFYKLFSLFNIHHNFAGYLSWKIFSFSGAILTMTASIKITQALCKENRQRLWVFVILFLGPQTILYFGFIGVEPFLVAVIYWFALYALRLNSRFTFNRLLAFWFISLLGIFLHISMLILVPAAIFITLKHAFKIKPVKAFIAGSAGYLILIFVIYFKASDNLEYAKHILFLSSNNINESYNLFSPKHLSDFFQIFWLCFPQIIILKYLFFSQFTKIKNKSNLFTLSLLVLSGNTLVFIGEPLHSIVLDAPRFFASLAPLAIFITYLLIEQSKQRQDNRHIQMIAVISLFIPLSILPVYTRINMADSYVESYLEKNPDFYYEGCLAFRDAYYYKKEFDKADQWEWKLPTHSQDYLDQTTAKEFTNAGLYPEALKLLYKMKTKNIFWTEPRYMLASIQMKLNRFQLAKPEIDTCLMLEPYNIEFHKILYYYYRDINDYNQALLTVDKALEYFPKNNEMKSDKMIYLYRLRDYIRADSLARTLIAADSTLPFPYLIRGFIAEMKKRPEKAISYFEKFITLAPDEMETPRIRKRLNKLVLEQREKR